MKAKIDLPFPSTAGELRTTLDLVEADDDTPVRVIGAGPKARLVVNTLDGADDQEVPE